jgi:hypothetical protein
VTFAERFKPTLRRIRSIPGRRIGLRPHRVYIRASTWTGTNVRMVGEGDGQYVEVEVEENGYPPKVRQVGDDRMALSNLPKGSLEVGPITTPTATVGITAEQFRGVNMLDLEQLMVRVEGPLGNHLYTIDKLTMDRAMHWQMTLKPSGEPGA